MRTKRQSCVHKASMAERDPLFKFYSDDRTCTHFELFQTGPRWHINLKVVLTKQGETEWLLRPQQIPYLTLYNPAGNETKKQHHACTLAV